MIRKIGRTKIKDKNGKMRKPTVDEARKTAVEKINKGIVAVNKEMVGCGITRI